MFQLFVFSVILSIYFNKHRKKHPTPSRKIQKSNNFKDSSSITRLRTIEACVSDLDSIKRAINNGFTSIELCVDRSFGGVTPSQGLIDEAVQMIHEFNLSKLNQMNPNQILDYQFVELHVLIRPRAGLFHYSDSEFDSMIRDIVYAREAGATGIVVGILDSDGKLDIPRMRIIKRLTEHPQTSSRMKLTFHRAFDVCTDSLPDLLHSLVYEIGVDRILTSGRCDRIQILPPSDRTDSSSSSSPSPSSSFPSYDSNIHHHPSIPILQYISTYLSYYNNNNHDHLHHNNQLLIINHHTRGRDNQGRIELIAGSGLNQQNVREIIESINFPYNHSHSSSSSSSSTSSSSTSSISSSSLSSYWSGLSGVHTGSALTSPCLQSYTPSIVSTHTPSTTNRTASSSSLTCYEIKSNNYDEDEHNPLRTQHNNHHQSNSPFAPLPPPPPPIPLLESSLFFSQCSSFDSYPTIQETDIHEKIRGFVREARLGFKESIEEEEEREWEVRDKKNTASIFQNK